MAGNSYTIDLDLTQSTQTKQALAQMNAAFERAAGNIDEMGRAYVDLSSQVEDVAGLEKAYASNVAASLMMKDREIKKLIEEQALIADINSDEWKAKNAQIKSAEAAKERLKSEAAHYKALAKEAALKRKFKAFFDPSEAGKSIKAQIEGVKKLAQSLKTVEGRMAAIEKLSSKIKAISGNASKVGAIGGKIGAGILGAGAAIGGAAIASAGNVAQKENALKALKGAGEEDADKVYIATGADYTTIVNAINKLSAKFKGDDLIAAAIQEVKTPGIASMLMAGKALDTSNIQSVVDQIKKSAGNADLSAAIAASTKARSVTTGAVSQTEYLSAFAALQNAGIEEEKINQIISSVAKKGGDFVEEFNKTDLSKYVRGQQKSQVEGIKIDRIDVSKKTEKSPAERLQESINRVSILKDKMLMKFMPKVADVVEKVLDSPSFEKMLESVGRISEQILPVLGHALDLIIPVVEKLLPPILKLLEPVLAILAPMLEKITPVLVWILEGLQPVIETVADVVEWLFSGKAFESISNAFSDVWEKTIKPGINSIIQIITSPIIAAVNAVIDGLNALPGVDGLEKIAAPQLANGGIAQFPSICGERGPELVLPLNNPARSQSLINNYNTTQNFTLVGAQTPLSLAQSIDNERFIRHAVRW